MKPYIKLSEEDYTTIQRGFMPPFVRQWVGSAFGGVPRAIRRKLKAVANETPYDEDTALSLVYATIVEYSEIQRWIKDSVAKSTASVMPSRKVNGKWVDAEMRLWPPFIAAPNHSSEVNSVVYHQPARYVFKHGDMRIDLGAAEGGYGAVLHNNPNSAMQAVCSRLKRRINGDYATVVRELTGYKATTTTVKFNGQWVVLVSAMRDSKETQSRYGVTEHGTVSMASDVLPSSINEVERALIKGIEQDADDDGYMEISDEWVSEEMLKDAEPAVDLSDPLSYAMYEMALEMGEDVEFMQGSAVWNNPAYDELLNAQQAELSAKLLEENLEYKMQMRVLEMKNASKAEIAATRQLFALEADKKARNTINRKRDILDTYRESRDLEPIQTALFTTRGAEINGVIYMPAKTYTEAPYVLPVTDWQHPQPKVTEVATMPVPVAGMPSHVEYFRGKANTVAINGNGYKHQMPSTKPKTQFSPLTLAIASGLELTGKLHKAIRGANRKLRFG